MVGRLVTRLLECPEVSRIIVTRNIPEEVEFAANDRLDVIENPTPKGFGANHNAGFRRCREPFFCVLNPDIELSENPFPVLVHCVEQRGAAVAAPLILSPSGEVEDSARYFPTVRSLLLKAIGGPDGRYSITPGQTPIFPDWVAGMFMLFRSADFARLGGFDKQYFLYYEDVDICARSWRAGMKVVICPAVSAVHDARRQSRRNLRHLRWHLASMGRYLWCSWRSDSAPRT